MITRIKQYFILLLLLVGVSFGQINRSNWNSAKTNEWAPPSVGHIYNGVDQSTALSDQTGVQSLTLVLGGLDLTTTEELMYLGTNLLVSSVSGTVTLGSGFTNATVYVNNTATTTLTANSRIIQINFDEVAIVSGYIATDGTNYGAFKCYDYTFYNYQRSTTEFSDKWNNGLPLEFKEPYETRDASNTELITDGDMTNAGSWTIGTSWDVNSTVVGKGYFDAVASGNISQTINIKANKRYKWNFTLSNTSSDARVGLFNLGGTSTYVAYAIYGDGVQSIEFTSGVEETTVAVWGSSTNSTFEIDDISLVTIGNTSQATAFGTNGVKAIHGGETVVGNTSGSPIAVNPIFDGKRLEVTSEVELVDTRKKGYRLIGVTAYNQSGASSSVTIGYTTGSTEIANADAIADDGNSYYSVNENNFGADSSLFVTVTVASATEPVTLFLDYEAI